MCVRVCVCEGLGRPSVIPPNSFSREVVSTLDVFLTVANLTGAPVPSDRPYDGKNMVRWPARLGNAYCAK